MKYYTIIIILCTFLGIDSNYCNQIQKRGLVGALHRAAYGISFRAIDSTTLHLDSLGFIIFCQDSKNLYILDGIAISEEIFEDEHLFDAVRKEGWYNFKFKDDDTAKCVDILRFYLNIDVPIVLNGTEIEESQKKNALSKISRDQLVSIKKKRSFFIIGKKYLEIITK
ncbi:MAG: hypothetical protein HZB59_13590 [Ignavibacteriales bacterium]|nr:hypothetical protein [Ignavibacteriales bacterium]